MKRILVDKYYLKTVVYAFLLIAAVIVFEKLLGNIEQVSESFAGFTNFIGGLLTPFIYGFCMAYLINPIVRLIERQIKKLSFAKEKKFPRPLSIFLAFVFIAFLVLMFVLYITPEISGSVSSISGSVKYYADLLEGQGTYITNESIANFFGDIIRMGEDFFAGVNSTFGTAYSVDTVIQAVSDGVNTVLNELPSIIGQILTGTMSFAGGLLNFIVGIFIAIYMLMSKEYYAEHCSRLLRALFRRQRAEALIGGFRTTNGLFERFFVGKTLDSAIIGALFLIVALIAGLPYPIMLALIIGITNMIPFAGPFIGAIPVIIIVFLTSLSGVAVGEEFSIYPTLITGISIVVIQQLDGNVIGPKILGDSTGLTLLEVIFAILVGGALWSIMGMLIGVPLLASIKVFIAAWVDSRLVQKEKEELQRENAGDGTGAE